MDQFNNEEYMLLGSCSKQEQIRYAGSFTQLLFTTTNATVIEESYHKVSFVFSNTTIMYLTCQFITALIKSMPEGG